MREKGERRARNIKKKLRLIEVHIKLIQWEINELAGDSSRRNEKLLEKIKSSLEFFK